MTREPDPSATCFSVRDYDLGATLDSGQAFRWTTRDGGWEGVVAGRWVRLRQGREGIEAMTMGAPGDWEWLRHYLQPDEDLKRILDTFPADPPLREAVAACRGLRLLRQDPWECLASFLLSSTKQIVQIRQIVELLCQRFGDPVAAPAGAGTARAFPTAERLADAGEDALRACRMGFRARYLGRTAKAVATGAIDLRAISRLPLAEARGRLMELDGVGRKIADCVLLFAFGFFEAFPVDVWVMRVLEESYFRGRRPGRARLMAFSESHFGPFGGYAQQYLFHDARRKAGRVASAGGDLASSPGDVLGSVVHPGRFRPTARA